MRRSLLAAVMAALVLISGCAATPSHITDPVDQALYQMRAAELKIDTHRTTLGNLEASGQISASTAENVSRLMDEALDIIAKARPLIEAARFDAAADALEAGALALSEIKRNFGRDGQEIADYVVIALNVAAGEMRTSAALAAEFPAP